MNLTAFSNHKQLFLDLNISIPFEVTEHEAALMILLQNLDYSQFCPPKRKSGRPKSLDPYSMILIILYARTQGKYSSRDVEKLCIRDIFLLKILGGRKAPDHSTFDRFIHNHEKAIDDLFFQITAQLDKLGELSKEIVYQDGTKMESKAGRYSYVWKKVTKRNLEKLKTNIQNFIIEVNDYYSWELNSNNLLSALEHLKEQLIATGNIMVEGKVASGKTVRKTQKFYRDTMAYIEKLKRYNEYLSSMKGRNSMSKTDPDATFMRMKEDHMGKAQLKPAYNMQVLVDSGYIVGAYASADRTDYATLIPALDHMHEHLPWKYSIYCSDSGYDCQQNFEYLENEKIDAYIKPQLFKFSKTQKFKGDIGRRENMTYDAKSNQFICANGKKLLHKGIKTRKNQYGYVIESHVYHCKWGCKSCRLRRACMKKSKAEYKQFEMNQRLDDYHKRAAELITSSKGVEIRQNRSIQAEGAFAQIKANWSFRRFLRSGMDGIYTEWLLSCMAMNAIRLGNRIARNEVGTPFHYEIQEEIA